MSDPRWLEINDDIGKAVAHYQTAVELFEEGGLGKGDRLAHWHELAFFQAMLSAYAATEQAFLSILSLIHEEPPVGPDWHRKLLTRLRTAFNDDHARPALISTEMERDLSHALRFRHVAMHVYDPLDIELAQPAYRAAKRLVASLPAAIADFKSVIDPD